MTQKFAVTFYTQWRGLLPVPVLGLPLALLALAATKLWPAGGILLYAGLLIGGFWGIFWLIKKWALVPSEVSISDTALTIETLTTGEVKHLPFAEIQAYRLDSEQLLLRLQDGRKLRLRVNYKVYQPTGFAEMCTALERALRAARGHDIIRLG
jgi:uncharacterized membrane protein